jgi:threonine synthase
MELSTLFKCSNCGRTQPIEFRGWRCPVCDGILNLNASLAFDPTQVDKSVTSMWRYRHTFPLPVDAAPVTLGEGNTPLTALPIDGRTVYFKCEHLLPTGSYKDRGMSVMFTALKALGITEALEDSSGNAGAAFAGYAAAAGIKARVFVPAAASGPKRRQIEMYGAELVAVDGPRSKAAEAVQAAANSGTYYGSHAYNPLGLPGLATCAYEIVEQLGHAPESVVIPIGHGLLLLGLYRGFQALLAAQVITRLPKLVGVQAMACAPLWAGWNYGAQGLGWVTEGATVAEGIRVLQPVRGDAVLSAVRETGGTVLAIDEALILDGRAALAKLGLYVEPTCGVLWEALKHVPGEVVAVTTGHGLKSA